MPTSPSPTGLHIPSLGSAAQAPKQRPMSGYWVAFAVTVVFIFALTAASVYSPGQDHFASIPLNGDGSWYYNDEVGFQIQDQDIFYHGIGHSLENAQEADVIFLGASTVLFGIDWRAFDEFSRRHHLKVFNMGFAGMSSGEFSLRIIRKFDLHPKLWIINTDLYLEEVTSSFFFPSLSGGAGLPASTVTGYGRPWAYKNVIGRNIRWRLRSALGSINMWSYRSAKTGNWYVDDWPAYASNKNPKIQPLVMRRAADATIYQTKRVDFSCPAMPAEVDYARRYLSEISGATVLVQVPNAFACAQRVNELASQLDVPALTVDETQFSSIDGGGHLDGVSAHKYTEMLFAWLEGLPEFKQLFLNPS